MQHDAFRSGNFDTNFVKTHFTPEILKSSMVEEKEALQHGINQIWDSIKKRDQEEFASREITSSWVNSRKG